MGAIMKRTSTLALLASVAVLAVTASLPARAESTSEALLMPDGKIVRKHAPVAQKAFSYRDMVAKTHPASIRNAVVVYERGHKKDHCDASPDQRITTCLHAPST
jgi:hypothetical protein